MKPVFFLLLFVLSLAVNSSFAEPPPLQPNAEAQQVLGGAALNFFIKKFNREVHSGKDIIPVLFPKISDADRQAMLPVFNDIAEIPRLSREGNAIVFHFKNETSRVEWPDFTKNQFRFGGISWTFDPTAPLKFQYDNFLKKMTAPERHAGFNFNIIPEAEAQLKYAAQGAKRFCEIANCKVFFSTISGIIVVTSASDLGCIVTSPVKLWTWTSFCRTWKTQNDETELEAARLEEQDEEPSLEWGPGGVDTKCPRNEAGVETFEAWMGENRKLSDGKWSGVRGKWLLVKGKATKRRLTELYVLPEGMEELKDPLDADVVFEFTKDRRPVLKAVKIKKEGSKDEFIKILTVDKEADVPVPYREENTRLKMLAKESQTWLEFCRRAARFSKIAPRRATEVIKAMQEQTDVPTTSPTPPPATK